jgi:hypothetical protein
MSDRLEEIKNKHIYQGLWGHNEDDAITKGDIEWLIAELERCREENAELNAIFELERTRSKQADKMWQKATDNPGTIPDLGVLLEWLMANIAELEEQINKWRASVEDADIMGMKWKELALEAEAENRELNAIFDLQRTRTQAAEKMWQEATGNQNVVPDLGKLIEWLMHRKKA